MAAVALLHRLERSFYIAPGPCTKRPGISCRPRRSMSQSPLSDISKTEEVSRWLTNSTSSGQRHGSPPWFVVEHPFALKTGGMRGLMACLVTIFIAIGLQAGCDGGGGGSNPTPALPPALSFVNPITPSGEATIKAHLGSDYGGDNTCRPDQHGHRYFRADRHARVCG